MATEITIHSDIYWDVNTKTWKTGGTIRQQGETAIRIMAANYGIRVMLSSQKIKE